MTMKSVLSAEGEDRDEAGDAGHLQFEWLGSSSACYVGSALCAASCHGHRRGEHPLEGMREFDRNEEHG